MKKNKIIIFGLLTFISTNLLFSMENISTIVKLEEVKNYSTQLIPAVKHADADKIKKLILLGCEVNQVNIYGDSPILEAIRLGNEEVLKLLIEFGADVNLKDLNGITPFMKLFCQKIIDKKIAEILMRAGVKINEQDNFGQTALMKLFLFEDDLNKFRENNEASILSILKSDPNYLATLSSKFNLLQDLRISYINILIYRVFTLF